MHTFTISVIIWFRNFDWHEKLFCPVNVLTELQPSQQLLIIGRSRLIGSCHWLI